MTYKKSAKNSIFYECKLCDYNTCKKGDYCRHVLTQKHKNNEIDELKEEIELQLEEQRLQIEGKNKEIKELKLEIVLQLEWLLIKMNF